MCACVVVLDMCIRERVKTVIITPAVANDGGGSVYLCVCEWVSVSVGGCVCVCG